MKSLTDWFKRNKAAIGALVGLAWETAGRVDPQLWTDYPRLMAYAGVVIGVVFGGGLFTKDRHERLKQDVAKAVEEAEKPL